MEKTKVMAYFRLAADDFPVEGEGLKILEEGQKL